MKRVYFVLGGLGLVGGVIGAIWGITSTSAPERGRRPETARRPLELADSTEGASSGSLEEVQRLRAELRQKDAQLRVLAALPRSAENAPAQPAIAAPQMPDVDPAASAADLLDERMLMAPENPRKAAEMEHALQGVATPSVLGEAKLTSLHCGPTLCKVTLSSESAAAINQSMIAMSSQLPKLFEATTVLPLGKGQSALYLASSGDELNIEPADQDKQ